MGYEQNVIDGMLLLAVSRRGRRTGTTTRMLEAVKPGDIVIAANKQQAINFRVKLSEYMAVGDVKIMTIDQLESLQGVWVSTYWIDHFAFENGMGCVHRLLADKDKQIKDLEAKLNRVESALR